MTHIADNLMIKASIPDVDLRLIDAMWDVQKLKARDIRPSDRLTIRQSIAAAERLGARLIALMGTGATMTCRVMPLMTQTTRVRKAPKRIWLEFSQDTAGERTKRTPVLFFEFARNKVNIGIYAPGFASDEARKKTWTRFRKHRPQVFRGLKQKLSIEERKIGPSGIAPGAWSLSTCRPPQVSAPCSVDVNDWLQDLTDTASKTAGAFAISTSLKNSDLSIDMLEMCLSEAKDVFAPFFDADFEATRAQAAVMPKLAPMSATAA